MIERVVRVHRDKSGRVIWRYTLAGERLALAWVCSLIEKPGELGLELPADPILAECKIVRHGHGARYHVTLVWVSQEWIDERARRRHARREHARRLGLAAQGN